MISDVTVGQYFPGNSLLHKLDARIKIVLTVLLMVAVFLCNNYVSMGLMVLLSICIILISKINLRVIFKGLKPIALIIIFTSLLNLFYGSGEPIVQWWIFKITADGIIKAVFMALRVLLLVSVGLMLTYTTTPTSLTDAIESLLKPLTRLNVDVHSFAMVMTIALRFIPTLVEEVDKIMSAQKSRGADIDSGGPLKRVKALVPVIIPLFVSSFRRAGELSDAMECRCYRGGSGRTKMKVMHLCLRDYLTLIFVIAVLAVVIALRFLLHSVL